MYETNERKELTPKSMAVPTHRDRIERDRKREHEEQIRTAVQFRSASAFLRRDQEE